MNRNTLITIAAIGIVAYLLLRKKNTPAKEIGQAPDEAKGGSKVEGLDAGTKAQTTATLKAAGVRVPKKRVIFTEDIKVPAKEPISIPAINLIPNVYDRGIGMEMPVNADGGQGYYNMSGFCSENMQNACRCADKVKDDNKLDIPSFL